METCSTGYLEWGERQSPPRRRPRARLGPVVFAGLLCCSACTPQRVVLDVEQGDQAVSSSDVGTSGAVASDGQAGAGGGQFSSNPAGDGGSVALSADVTITGATLDCTAQPATCPGALMPGWQLPDFQPQSSGYQMTYGLKKFAGTTTVVALLAAW